MFFFQIFMLFIGISLFFSVIQIIGSLYRRKKYGSVDSLKATQALSKRQARMTGMSEAEEERLHDSMTLSVCFARFAVQVAMADGRISQQEVQSILGFFRGANATLLMHIQEVLQRDLSDPASIDWNYNLNEAQRVLAKQEWKDFGGVIFDGLLRITISEGSIRPNELEVVFRIMSQLGWSSERIQSGYQARMAGGKSRTAYDPNLGLADAYAELNLKPSASADEVKKRFRELAHEHHPDRYAQMGEEMQKTAAERFRRIKEAHDLILSSRKK